MKMNIQILVIAVLVLAIIGLIATRNRGATQDFTQIVMPAQINSQTAVSAVDPNGLFDLRLEVAGGNKIEVIKALRTMTDLGLKETKDLMDSAPVQILSGVTSADAERARQALVAAGATVSVTPQGIR